jgi:hypothetical protein
LQEKSPKGNILFKKGIFCHKYIFLKPIPKNNHKLILKKYIAIILIIVDYKTFENVSPK